MPPSLIERDTLNEKDIERLVASYKRAQKRIIGEFDTATDFGQARRAQQLAGINAILTELGTDTADWINTVVPKQYQRGTKDALAQLTALKVGIKDNDTFSVIDRRAAAALSTELGEAFAMSLTTAERAAGQALSKAAKEAVRQELVEGNILGSTLKERTARIKAQLKADGLAGLVDKGGNTWSLDRYADMLARTKMVEARNAGLANKMVANGYDLVEVSNHNSDHKACAQYEGKILSLTGKTPGYPTLEAAMRNGLLHPNCKHQINAVKTNYNDILKAYDPKDGEYKTPFERNQPKPVPNPPAKPTGGGRTRAVALTPETPKVSKTKITFMSGGKTDTYKLNKAEGAFVAESGIRLSTSNGKTLLRDRGVQGYYSPLRNELVMRDVGTDYQKHTFYHELGHALDFRLNLTGGRAPGTLHEDANVKAALKADGYNVLARRIQKDTEHKGNTITFEQARIKARGGMAEWTDANGFTRRSESTRKWLKYAKQFDELFADAYGQYRLEPKKFEAYAPAIFNAFKELGL